MDSAEQANGEKRVKGVLIDPLMRRGLAKPTSLTKAQFGDMMEDLCARLAYMTDANLMALEEQVAANAGGKERDRFPIGQRILEWAAQIQPPGDDASPLIRAVFANQLGLDAVTGGWAPELLVELRTSRRWPNAWQVKTIKDKADGAVRQLRDLDAKLARGDALSPSEDQWRSRRLSVIAKCQRIADLGQGIGDAGRADG
jgi:hypothetical protein